MQNRININSDKKMNNDLYVYIPTYTKNILYYMGGNKWCPSVAKMKEITDNSSSCYEVIDVDILKNNLFLCIGYNHFADPQEKFPINKGTIVNSKGNTWYIKKEDAESFHIEYKSRNPSHYIF